MSSQEHGRLNRLDWSLNRFPRTAHACRIWTLPTEQIRDLGGTAKMVIRQVSARGVHGVPAYRQGRQTGIWPVGAGCIIMAQVAPAVQGPCVRGWITVFSRASDGRLISKPSAET